ncbi:MAG: ACT domain-containing protein, partial [Methanotrichaceae archaeon]
MSYSLAILKFTNAIQASHMNAAINVICADKPGMLRDVAGVVANKGGNITYVQSFILERGINKGQASMYIEIDGPSEGIVKDLQSMESVFEVTIHQPFERIYGSRVII